ncbi:hypothetical protein QBC35DRAFT_194012 [Podospora australis]|uniref:CFEM domain-containing protein n=1 Tax=Podospora australis TaxID=1536484 RepID=A0AAN6WHX4_9PEZI|nr:hypothetical protein QBC35DRAFT_194012 [Podospora australis]
MWSFRNAYALVGLWLLFLFRTTAALGPISQQDALAAVPSCAAPCFEMGINQTSCAIDGTPCLCHDKAFNDAVTVCVKSVCSVKESLTTKNATYHMCDHPGDGRDTLISPFAVFLGLAVLAVILRLVARVLTQAYFWWDDLFNGFGIIGCAVFTGLNLKAVDAGMGTDIWFVPFDNVTKILQLFYADMLLYTVTRFFIRNSIILFYLRVFPAKGDSKLGKIILITLGANLVYNFSFFFAVMFQCHPIKTFWTAWEGLHEGHCGNINILAWVAAATGIVFDLWLLALPFPQLLSLNLHWKKKLMGASMFFVGAAVMIISLIRLKTINSFTRAVNPTKDIADVCLWSGIELDVGVICPCLPSFRLLFKKAMPRLLGTNSGTYELDAVSGTTKSNARKSQGRMPENPMQTGTFTRPHKDSHDRRSCISQTGLVETSDEEGQAASTFKR